MIDLIRKYDDFLAEPNIAVLATVRPDGRPHAVPMWYLWEDGAFFFGTAKGSVKHRNLATKPDAWVVVERRTSPVFALMCEGRAEIGSDLTKDQAYRLCLRYLKDEGAARTYMETFPETVGIRIRPHRASEFHGN